jgi:DNA replication protein DnaC
MTAVSSAALSPLPPGIRLLRNDEVERLRQRYPKVPSSPERCPTCYGTGEFQWWGIEIGGERPTVPYHCDCISQWTLHLYLLNANIGSTYQRLSWADVATEQGAIDKARGYLERADAYVRAGCGLILYGEMGTGKTLLSTLILKHLLGMGYDGYFTTFSEMIDTYTGGWHDAEEKAWFHRRIKNAEVLVLDDVGREYQGRKSSGLPESTFDEVLRHRVAAATPTIITTNLDLKSLQEGYGGNVMSLLHERSTTYRFTGEDFRDAARYRLDEEVQRGLTRPVVIG